MPARRARSFFILVGYTNVFVSAHCRPFRTIGLDAKSLAPKSSCSSVPHSVIFSDRSCYRVDHPPVVPTQNDPASSAQVPSLPSIPPHPQTLANIASAEPLVHPPPQGSYGYPVYGHPIQPHPRGMHPPTAPPQSWQAPNAIAPQQTHMAPQPPSGLLPRPPPYRDGPWVTGFDQPPPHMVPGPSGPPYPYRYRDDQADWAAAPPNDYPYDPATVSLIVQSPVPCADIPVQYEQTYEQAPFMHDPGTSAAGPSNAQPDTAPAEKSRGRKRTRNQASFQCIHAGTSA